MEVQNKDKLNTFEKDIRKFLSVKSEGKLDMDEIDFIREFFRGKGLTAPFISENLIPFLIEYKNQFVFDKNRRL